MDEQEEIRRAVAEGRAIVICTPCRFRGFEPPSGSRIVVAGCCGEEVWAAPYQFQAALMHSIPVRCMVCSLDWFYQFGRL